MSRRISSTGTVALTGSGGFANPRVNEALGHIALEIGSLSAYAFGGWPRYCLTSQVSTTPGSS